MKIRARSALVAALAATLALTACSSGDGDTHQNGKKLIDLSVGYTSEGGLQIPVYIADEMGLFEKYGLNVKLVKLNSSSSLIPAIAGGSVNVGTGDGSAICAGILTGTKLNVIGANLSTFTLEAWGPDSVTSFKDLKGSTVGVTAPGSTSDFALNAALAANGMSRSDVKVVYLHSLPATVAAVESGAAKATLVVPPYGGTLKPKGYHRIYDTSQLQHVSTAFAVTPSFAKSNATALSNFSAAMADAVGIAAKPANESKVVPILSKRAAVSADDAKYTYKYFQPLWVKDLQADPKNWSNSCDAARATSKVKAGVDPASALDMSYLPSK